MTVPRKAGGRRCDKCGGPLGRRYQVHDDELTCHSCFHAEVEEQIKTEVSRRTVSEQNDLMKKVCPACKRRLMREG